MSTQVEVPDIRYCDIHKYEMGRPDVVAWYDGKTKRGPWANMCTSCFNTQGVGLGTGRGQAFIYPEGLIDQAKEAKP